MGTVDYTVLQNRRGHTELLARLLNEELNHENPSDVVLVLGPTSRFFDKLPEGLLDKPANSAPRFFFLKYGLTFRVEASLSDTISMAMSKLKGKTLVIRTPADFVKAIDLVERRAVGSGGN